MYPGEKGVLAGFSFPLTKDGAFGTFRNLADRTLGSRGAPSPLRNTLQPKTDSKVEARVEQADEPLLEVRRLHVPLNTRIHLLDDYR